MILKLDKIKETLQGETIYCLITPLQQDGQKVGMFVLITIRRNLGSNM